MLFIHHSRKVYYEGKFELHRREAIDSFMFSIQPKYVQIPTFNTTKDTELQCCCNSITDTAELNAQICHTIQWSLVISQQLRYGLVFFYADWYQLQTMKNEISMDRNFRQLIVLSIWVLGKGYCSCVGFSLLTLVSPVDSSTTLLKTASPCFLIPSVTMTVIAASSGVGCPDVEPSSVPELTIADWTERRVTTKALTRTGSRKERTTLGISLEPSLAGKFVIFRLELFSSMLSVPSDVTFASSPSEPSMGSIQYPAAEVWYVNKPHTATDNVSKS